VLNIDDTPTFLIFTLVLPLRYCSFERDAVPPAEAVEANDVGDQITGMSLTAYRRQVV